MAVRYTDIATFEFYYGENITDTEEAGITAAIEHAEGFIDSYCRRRFDSVSYTEIKSGEGIARLYATNMPIISLSEIVKRDTDDGFIAANAETLSEFILDNEVGEIYWANGTFSRGQLNWRITYTGGFAVVPPDITSAATIMTAALLRGRLTDFRPGLQQVSTSGIAALYVQDIAARIGVIQMLKPWVVSRII